MKKIAAFSGILVLLVLVAFRCKVATEESSVITPVASDGYKGVLAFPKLSFNDPIDFTHANDGTNRLFVVEQKGVIQVFENNISAEKTSVFLDISSRVASGGEMGLLGLAFHPNFKINGFFYVNYTRSSPRRQTVIARFKANGTTADPSSETILFTFDQPYSNHNGGQIAFGADGFLYVATGRRHYHRHP